MADSSSKYAQAEKFLTTWVEALKSSDWAMLVAQWEFVARLLEPAATPQHPLIVRALAELRSWSAAGRAAKLRSSWAGQVREDIARSMKGLLDEVQKARAAESSK